MIHTLNLIFCQYVLLNSTGISHMCYDIMTVKMVLAYRLNSFCEAVSSRGTLCFSASCNLNKDSNCTIYNKK